MTTPPVPEKTLLQMDLSRGLDERARPEVGGDQSKLITVLDNLVQEQTGAWEKRPGLEPLTVDWNEDLLVSGVTVPITTADKVVAFTDGPGLISGSKLYHYNSVNRRFRAKNRVSEFGVTGYTIASSQATVPKENTGTRILCSAHNSVYDVVVYESGVSYGTNTSGTAMVVHQRDTGMEVVHYDLTATLGTLKSARAVFCGDRYFHLYYNQADDLEVIQFDTQSPWPQSFSNFTQTTVDAAVVANTTVNDICSISDRSFIVAGDFVYSVTTALVVDFQDLTDPLYSCDVYEDGNLLWLAGNGPSTNRVRIVGLTADNISAAATHDWTDATVTSLPIQSLAATTTGIVLEKTDTATMGNVAVPRVRYYSAAAAATALTLEGTFYGSFPSSTLFCDRETDRVYLHLVKRDLVANDISIHFVACMSDVDSVVWNATGADPLSVDRAPIACNLEPYLGRSLKAEKALAPGTADPLASARLRYFKRIQDDQVGSPWAVVLPVQVTARSNAISVLDILPGDPKQHYTRHFGGISYLSGGVTSQYDGYRAAEAGFSDMPLVCVQESATAGGPNGAYNYLAVFKHVDSKGNVTYSKTSGPFAVTATNKKVNVTVQGCHFTNRESGQAADQQVVIELYRTVASGTQYFLCASTALNQPGPTQQLAIQTSGFFLVADNYSDATIAAAALFYRQPGTANSPLDRFPPPAGSHIMCQHKDRLFITDPYGLRVYYSSFFVEGENAWFNPAFSFNLHGGSGPITAMATMDGRLFVSRRDAWFIIDGDGPPENGGNGTEFSTPQRLATDIGCVDQRSVIVTSKGIFFLSRNGIYLLTRSLDVMFVGDRVQNTVGPGSSISGVVCDQDGRLRFFLEGTNREAVFDTNADCWSTSTYNVGQVTGVCQVGNSTVISAKKKGGLYGAYTASREVFTDDGTWVPWTVQTGYVRPSGAQGRHILREALLLGRKQTNHSLELALDYDWEETYSDSESWDADKLTVRLEEVKKLPKDKQPVSFSLKAVESAPTNQTDYPYGTGKGLDLLGIAFWVAPKVGPQKIAANLRG